MTDLNKRFGEVLSDHVFLNEAFFNNALFNNAFPNEAFLERMHQIRSPLRKGYLGAVAGRFCLISVDPVC